MMVLRAMLGMGFAMMLVSFAPTPIWFATLFVLIGVFNDFTPTGVALIVSNTPPTRIGRAMSYAQSGCMVGPLRLQWIRDLRELLGVPRMGPLFLLSFLFSAMWYGSVTNISVFVLQLLESQSPDASAEAFWVGAAAVAMATSMLVALPLWGRLLDRIGAGRVLVVSTVATIVLNLPLLVLQTPLQLVLARVAFGLTSTAMPTAIFALLRVHAPKGMDARAISYSTAFLFFGMRLAPFSAGLISLLLGKRLLCADDHRDDRRG